jgi:hypothetical protein
MSKDIQYHLISLNGFTWNFCGLSLPASNWFYEGTRHITKNETLIYCTIGEASTPSNNLIPIPILFCVPTHLQHWAYFLVSSLLPNIQVHIIIIIQQFGKKKFFKIGILMWIPLSPLHPPSLDTLVNIYPSPNCTI